MGSSSIQNIIPLLQSKTKTVQRNLTSWTPAAWLIYTAVVPLILIAVELLSPQIKNGFFILDTTAPQLSAILLSSYTHSDISHLGNNIGLYLLALIMIFCFCTSPKLMYRSSLIVLLSVPLLASAVTIYISSTLGQGFYSQGFSAVAYAYTALGLYAFFCWVMPDIHTTAPGYDPSGGYPANEVMALLLVMGAIVLVLTYGLLAGGLSAPDGSFVNGPAHVTGFFTGILTAALVDLRLRTNDRRINHLFILCGSAMLLPYYLMLQ